MMGVKHIVVAINKMDLVDYSPFVFNKIEKDYRDIAKVLGIPYVTIIPVSAVNGDNITKHSENTPWYHGPTLIGHLEHVEIAMTYNAERFALPVQWVNRPDANFRGLSGQIASGRICIGERVTILPSKRDAVLSRIVTFDGELNEAESGQSVTLVLDRELDISRGDVIALSDNLVGTAKSVEAQLLWMSTEAFDPYKSYLAKIGTTTEDGASIFKGFGFHGASSILYNVGVGIGWTRGLQLGMSWPTNAHGGARYMVRLQRAF